MKLKEELKSNIFDLFLLLSESKQSLINIGYPDYIASEFYKRFGKLAPLIAKWYKDYVSYKFYSRNTDSFDFPSDWFRVANTSFSRREDVGTYIQMLNAASKSLEALNAYRSQNDYEPLSADEFNEHIDLLKEEIIKKVFNDIFFQTQLVQDIASGKIKDVAPYKNLNFSDARDKYDEKNIFSNNVPLKTYKNNWSWIDVGARCQLIGKKMRNCGSAGVMSNDPDKTMIVLFDPNNNPHVIVTYSPNEKRISGIEGQASTLPKNKYSRYILDLEKVLGANIDLNTAKASALKVLAANKGNVKTLKKLNLSSFTEFFFVTAKNGKQYYTDTYNYIDSQEVENYRKENNFDNPLRAFREIIQNNRFTDKKTPTFHKIP